MLLVAAACAVWVAVAVLIVAALHRLPDVTVEPPPAGREKSPADREVDGGLEVLLEDAA